MTTRLSSMFEEFDIKSDLLRNNFKYQEKKHEITSFGITNNVMKDFVQKSMLENFGSSTILQDGKQYDTLKYFENNEIKKQTSGQKVWEFIKNIFRRLYDLILVVLERLSDIIKHIVNFISKTHFDKFVKKEDFLTSYTINIKYFQSLSFKGRDASEQVKLLTGFPEIETFLLNKFPKAMEETTKEIERAFNDYQNVNIDLKTFETKLKNEGSVLQKRHLDEFLGLSKKFPLFTNIVVEFARKNKIVNSTNALKFGDDTRSINHTKYTKETDPTDNIVNITNVFPTYEHWSQFLKNLKSSNSSKLKSLYIMSRKHFDRINNILKILLDGELVAGGKELADMSDRTFLLSEFIQTTKNNMIIFVEMMKITSNINSTFFSLIRSIKKVDSQVAEPSPMGG